MERWIFHKDEKHTQRYTLGIDGEKMLICCGINPNTASPNKLNNTVKSVEKFARNNDYDGYLVVNVYSQISRYPHDIHLEMDEDYHKGNIKVLRDIFKTYPRDKTIPDTPYI